MGYTPPEEIDIGNPAINSNDNYTFFTRVDANNPANATGKITSVEIWANTQIAGCKVATFSASGNNLTTRDYETVDNGNGAGVVLAGSKQTFVVDLNVEVGDVIGLWGSAGRIEMDNIAIVTGTWYNLTDQIPCSAVEFTLVANKTISLYGSGASGSGELTIGEAFSVVDSKVTKIVKALGETFSIVDSFAHTIILHFYEAILVKDSFTTYLKSIWHKVIKSVATWIKVDKDKDDWSRVEKEKEDWNRVDETDVGWFVNGWFEYGWFISSLWGIVNKTMNGWEKIIKE